MFTKHNFIKLVSIQEPADEFVSFYLVTDNGRILLDHKSQNKYRKLFKNSPGYYVINSSY